MTSALNSDIMLKKDAIMSKNKLKIIGIIAGVTLACILVFSGICIIHGVRNRNVEVEAIVISVEGDDYDTIEYEYTYKNKTCRAFRDAYESREIGENVKIHIRRANPEKIYEPGDDYMAVGIYMLIGVLGIGLIVVGAIALIVMTTVTIIICRKKKV